MEKAIEININDGDYKSAAGYYNQILDANPLDRRAIAGYYATNFWANRQDLINMEHRGKHRAAFLINEWEQFEKEIELRNLTDLPIIALIMQSVFHHASVNLKEVFQKEGSRSVSADLLENLGLCLLRCKDYKNAIEVMEYSQIQYQANVKILFYLAECYYRTNNIDKSKLFYKEALFLESQKLIFNLIEADYIHKLIETINNNETQIEQKDILDWVFVYGIATKVLNINKKQSSESIKLIFEDIAYLESKIDKLEKPLRKKVELYLLKKNFYLIDYFEFMRENNSNINRLADRIHEINPEIYNIYMANKTIY